MIATYKLKPNVSSVLQTYTDDANLIGVQTGFWVTYPQAYYSEPYTYAGATTNDAVRNPILLRYDSRDNSVVHVDVGIIDNIDVTGEFHQRPVPIVHNDFVYVFQVNGHGEDIKVWKSNSTDITDGFTLHHTITGFNYGYIRLYKKPDNTLVIGSRRTDGTGSDDFGHIIITSDDTNYNSFTSIQVTNPQYTTTDYRHYIIVPIHYGTNSWHYVGIMSRNDAASNTYFAQSYYKTQDFITYYSLDENFSKNVSSNNYITSAEVDSNLTFIGSQANDTVAVQQANGCVINDVVYGSYYNNTDNEWKLYKIESGVLTEYDMDDPQTDNSQFITITYNGNNLVFSTRSKIYTSNLNFENQQLVFEATDTDGSSLSPVGRVYPLINASEVQDKYALFASSGNTGLELLGTARYYITSDKFIR